MFFMNLEAHRRHCIQLVEKAALGLYAFGLDFGYVGHTFIPPSIFRDRRRIDSPGSLLGAPSNNRVGSVHHL